MPIETSYPGVYISEASHAAAPIQAAPTSNTAFVGYLEKGPYNDPTQVRSFADFRQVFGDVNRSFRTSYAVFQFFLNGGDLAWIVRIEGEPTRPTLAAFGVDTATPAGIDALDSITPGQVNLLCVPDMAALSTTAGHWNSVFVHAFQWCTRNRAFLIADVADDVVDTATSIPEQVRAVESWFTSASGTPVSGQTSSSAVYFPRIVIDDPAGGDPLTTDCAGTIAGLYVRTDAESGVWQAPGGARASLTGVLRPAIDLDDQRNGQLNSIGVNCIRQFPTIGTVSWGARTTDGSDALESEWKYVPIRRLGSLIVQSVHDGTAWAVFEPNDETLWGRLERDVTDFMTTLWNEGAFAGTTPAEAFQVKCDAETTTQADRDAGIVHVLIRFAPLQPAEFIILNVTLAASSTASD